VDRIARRATTLPMTRRIALGAAGAGVVVLLAVTGLPAGPAAAAVTAGPDAVTCPSESSTGVLTPAPTAGVDWSGCDLNYAVLDDATLTGADLSGAQLAHAAIKDSSLAQADLSGAALGNATVTGDDLSGADLAGTGIGSASLAEDNLTGATVSDATIITGTVLTGVNLTGVDLGSVTDFSDIVSGGITDGPATLPSGWELVKGYLLGQSANLTGANLAGDNLSGLDLQYALLNEAAITGATIAGTNLADAGIAQLKSGGVTGTPASFPAGYKFVDGYVLGQDVDLDGVNLTKLPLADEDLSYSSLRGADLAGSNIHGIDLSNGDLTGANLEGTTLSSANLQAATLTGVNAANASLSGAHLGAANMTKANLANATLTGADLSDANLRQATLTNADLHSATVTAVQLAGASLTGLRSGALAGAPSTLPAGWSATDGYLVGPHANLASANFQGAFPLNVSFTWATLTRANFTNANLESADFRGANLTDATFAGANLAGAALTPGAQTLTGVTWSTATTCPDGNLVKTAKTGCFASPAKAPPLLRLTVRRGAPGTVFQVTGTGFRKAAQLTITVAGTKRATAKASASGAFGPVTVTVPVAVKPGLHQVTAAVTATGKTPAESAAQWFTVAADWAQGRGDAAQDADNPTENVITAANASTLIRRFTVNPGGGAQEAFTPAIDDGTAYIAAWEGPLTAVNAITGKKLWSWSEPTSWDSSHVPPQLPLSAPTVADGTVYLSTSGEGIVAISGGKLLWQSQTRNAQGTNVLGLSQPTLANGVLYATDGLYGVFAINPGSGAQLWDAVPAPWPTSPSQSCSSPAVSGGVLYLACSGGYVYAMSASTGKTLWYDELAGDPALIAATVSGGTVYATDTTGMIYAVSTATHGQLRSFATGNRTELPAVAAGTVYAIDENGVLHALNAATGATRWSAVLDDGNQPTDPYAPSVAGDVVYALSGSEVAYAFNAATGKRLWSNSIGNTLQSTPVVANGMLYLGTGTGGITAFQPK
jgi:uncharacterized protein YjbI with pentapeptide repeats/outer membrane protein assembly factor BamB